jgi:hypothetical protein
MLLRLNACLQPLPGHVQSEGLTAASRWRRTGETVVRGRVVLALIFALQASTPSSAAPPPASSKDVYGGLVAPGATWRLTADGGADGPALIGEVLGVDTIAGVRVARLRWTVSTAEGSRTLDFPEPLPTAVVVSTRGLWILDDLFEDSSPSDGPLSAEVVKRIEKQLKRSPSFRSPPKMIAPETRKDGVYVERVDTAVGSGVCIGVGPGRDDEPCDDVCYSQYCLVAGHGVVSVSGRLASTVAGSDELWQPASRPPKSAP